MFDTLERLDEDGDAVFEARREMRIACYDRGVGRGAAYAGQHPEFGFTDYHENCDYCALIFAYRNRRKAG